MNSIEDIYDMTAQDLRDEVVGQSRTIGAGRTGTGI